MRVFVGIEVGDEMRARVQAARRTIETELSRLAVEVPRIVWMKPAALHVTLTFLGEQPDARVGELIAELGKPYAQTPFPVSWRGLGAFPSPRRPRALWVGATDGVRELGALEREVAERLGRLLPGEAQTAPSPFHPHVTIARVKTDGQGVDWPALLAAVDISGLTTAVTHVSVFRSRGLPGGEGYEEIGRGPLG